MKPLWLLDVDGVLNAVNDLDRLRQLEATHWPDCCQGVAGRYPIIWSPTLVKRITAIHDAGLAEIRWLTTWESRAQSEIAPLLGLPHFELAGKRSPSEGLDWWKLPIAQAATSPERPLIWTDDDLTPQGLSGDIGGRKALAWAINRYQEYRTRTLLVDPKWDLGISPVQMDSIERFITEETASPAARFGTELHQAMHDMEQSGETR